MIILAGVDLLYQPILIADSMVEGGPFLSQNGRLGGRSGETVSRNMAATKKMNFLTLVSYSLLQTLFG